MQDGWHVDREHSSVVFLPIANHDCYLGTNHPYVSTYLLTHLPTEAGKWVGNHLHSLPTHLLRLPINIGSLPRWCAVEVGEITGYGYQGTQLSQNGFSIDDAQEGAGSHNLPIFA